MNCSRRSCSWSLVQRLVKRFAFAILVIAAFAFSFIAKTNLDTFRTMLGLRAMSSPLPVRGAKVHKYKNIGECLAGRNDESRTSAKEKSIADEANTDNDTIRLKAFDDRFGASSHIPREWNLFLDQHPINATQVASATKNANVCFRIDRSDHNVRCLPSFVIVGFEKASTTALSIWLSHHPNLKSRWREGRFFDHVNSAEELDRAWFEEYLLKTIPRQPGGMSGAGRYFTFEKSPAYAPSSLAPEMMARLIPSARLLFMVRNPTSRAYSFFLMLTNHFPGAKEVLSRRPLSFFVKNNQTGAVRYVGDRTMKFDIGPGEGGQTVPSERMPSGLPAQGEEWQFLPHPPDPMDFHSWIIYMLDRFKGQKPNFNDQSRPHRLLFGGFYYSYLKRWLHYFPPEQFVLLDEKFYRQNVPRSMVQLQEALGLPVYNYSRIGKRPSSTGTDPGRFNINSPAAYANNILNSAGTVPSMLEETQILLDAFYCEENRDLKRILGGRSLPGYSCAD